MTYANPDERKSLIAGLRRLADFLETNPEVPSPPRADVMVFPAASADEQAFKEVNAIAALVGAQVYDRIASHGHYTASRYFGPVQYWAVVIPRANRACRRTLAPAAKAVIAPGKEVLK